MIPGRQRDLLHLVGSAHEERAASRSLSTSRARAGRLNIERPAHVAVIGMLGGFIHDLVNNCNSERGRETMGLPLTNVERGNSFEVGSA